MCYQTEQKMVLQSLSDNPSLCLFPSWGMPMPTEGIRGGDRRHVTANVDAFLAFLLPEFGAVTKMPRPQTGDVRNHQVRFYQ